MTDRHWSYRDERLSGLVVWLCRLLLLALFAISIPGLKAIAGAAK